MKAITTFFAVPVFCILCFMPAKHYAQRAAIRDGIERSMIKKHAEPHRKKGKEEIEKVTYENDKRYQDPTNKIQATIIFENKEFDKKGTLKNTSKDKIIFGKTGECMVMREGTKDEMWFIFNYADKANYMVYLKDKTAMKMPLINMKKMIEKGAQHEAADVDAGVSWSATDEYQTINGYRCRKFVYTRTEDENSTKMDAWVSNEVKLNLGDNYLLGARLNTYRFPTNETYKEMSNGFIVRSVFYNKKGLPEFQRDLISLQQQADEKYFDMTPFKVNDILDKL